MGERQLLAVGAALIAWLAPALAQGPVYRERWGYTHLERLRAIVRGELAGRDSNTRSRVAALLAERDDGVPFAPPAKALAMLRGVPADAAFVLRATIGVYLLPEVCDPQAANEVCRQLNASVFLPFSVASPGKLSFHVQVRDRAGAVAFEATLIDDTAIDDLRMARPAARVPGAELADGAYQLIVRTFVDGVPPGERDPVLRLPFHVLRGYQARSEAAMKRAGELAAGLPPLQRALLTGLAAEVSRAYLGEAFDTVSDAVVDLQRLEAGIGNVTEEKHVLHGFVGDVATALPLRDGQIACVLRLGADRNPAMSTVPLPLVVFASGAPAYDTLATRPTAPATRGPRWAASDLPAFGAGKEWNVAFLESPGGGRNYALELGEALAALRGLWRMRDQPLVLVCEREAAAIAGLRTATLREHCSALVLVGGGALPGPAIDQLGKWPVRVGPVHGHASSDGLLRALDYVELKKREPGWQGDFERLGAELPAWPFGLPAFAAPIAAFVDRCVRR